MTTATSIPTNLVGPLASSLVALSALIPIIAYIMSTSPKLRRTTHAAALTMLRLFAYAVGYFTIALIIIPITILYYVDMHWDSISPWNLIYGRAAGQVMVSTTPTKGDLTTRERSMIEECRGDVVEKARRRDSIDSNISALDLGESVMPGSEDDSAVDLSLGDERDVVVREK